MDHQRIEELDSIYSDYEFTATKAGFLENVRYKWDSKWDFITSTIICVLSTRCLDAFISTTDKVPSIYHYAILFILVVLPIYNMQLLLGQYTQLGTAFFKYLSPISHGVGIVFIINLFLRTIRQSLLLDDAVIFLIKSMQTTLQWTICPPYEIIPCFEESENCANLQCGNKSVYLPASIFYINHILGSPEHDATKMRLVWPKMHKMAIHAICWCITCFTLIFTINHYIKVIRLICHSILILLVVLITVVTIPDMTNSFKTLFAIKPNTFASVDIWCSALSTSVQLMALGRAFHIVHGSYLHADAPCGLYSIICSSFYFLITSLCCLFTTSCILRLARYTNTDMDHLYLIFSQSSRATLFILIPQAIGFLGLPQVWSCLYFIIIILMALGQQVTHLIFMESSLGDLFPNLLRYRRYVVILLSLSSGLLGIFLMAPETYVIYQVFCVKVPEVQDSINVLLMVFFVCWVYGVRRFSDDIQFSTGQTASMFWKLCWYIMPVLILVCFCRLEILYYYQVHPHETILQLILVIIFSSPVPIAALLEIFRYMKKKNLRALFLPQERFGSPIAEERELRMIFNPRTETKARRRAQTCKHRCILGSPVRMNSTGRLD